MLSFSQNTSGAVENPEAFDCERGAHYNGNYSIYFSSKRPIDKLKLRIITILQDQLEEAKISQTRVRVWFADEARVSDLKKRIREEEAASEGEPKQPEALSSAFVLENGHCLDLIG